MFYNTQTAQGYDDMVKSINYNEPHKVAEAISDAADPENPDSVGFLNLPRDARIFDMGAGTGILGQLLKDKGFTNIEAGDASENFISAATERGLYNGNIRTIWFGLGTDKLPAEIV